MPTFFQSNSLKILKDSAFKVLTWQADARVLHYTQGILKKY